MLNKVDKWILKRKKELSTKAGILQLIALIGILYGRSKGQDFGSVVSDIAIGVAGISSLTSILKAEK